MQAVFPGVYLRSIKNGEKFKLLLLSGSLRKASTNTGLLKAVQKMGHPKMSFEWIDISEFPVFNQDIEAKGYPASIEKARKQIQNAHALLIASTQYNFSISAPLKNAYDWLSRKMIIKEMPIALVSSAGGYGGKKSQEAFRISAQFLKHPIMPAETSEFTLNHYAEKCFDQNACLVKEEVKEKLKNHIEKYSQFLEKTIKKDE